MAKKRKTQTKKASPSKSTDKKKPKAKKAAARKGTGKRDGRTKSSGGLPTAEKKQPSSSGQPAKQKRKPQCVVVGIGASAGGLEAFRRFLKAMPHDSGMAFVLIQHLDPDHESLMADLLSKYTAMPVVQAEDATAIEPNRVYMIPPNKFIKVHEGGLFLDEPIKRRGMRMPIDYFFRSLATARRERSVGIILSGTGSDGTLGLKEIKAQGGMIMVQQPDTADYDGMPRSALSTGMVDFISPIEDMPGVLIKYVQHPYIDRAGDGQPTLLETAPDHYKSIINLLRAHTDYDFRCYKKGTLSRRIQRRMGLRHVENIADYLALLRKDREELNRLFKDLLISVTAFFREKEAWATLETEVIAKLVAEKKFDQPVRVWVPGCATGEEAYSIAMLLFEQFELQNKNLDVQIFATDLDEDAISAARQGFYPSSIAGDIASNRLTKFFREDGEGYRVNKRLREASVFAVQNLIGDPPFSNLDVISCRNVMIYLEQDIQQKLIQMFHFALRPGGSLFLGTSESVGKHGKLFHPISKQWRIYRKTGVSRRGAANFPIIPPEGRAAGQVVEEAGYEQPFGSVELARKVLLEKFAPASVLINRKYEVQYFHGPVRQYLDIPSGEPTTDLTAMCLEGLRSKLRGVIHKCLHEDKSATVVAPRVRRNGGYVAVEIQVDPLPHRKGAETMLLVSFSDEEQPKPEPASPSQAAGTKGNRDSKPPAGTTSIQDDDADQAVEQLEYELQATREDLQSTIEELETSNEELKASNEEVMSMNEELQSTNEELETSREELQSLNEELSTVNSQLEEKVNELENTNNDLTNLLSSTEIATIFLDTEFRIRLFTPATMELLHVINTDVGRPISDLSPRFNDPNLYRDARNVLQKLMPIEREVCVDTRHAQDADEGSEGDATATDGRPHARSESTRRRWFIRRILPYRTSENRIDGVVVTFTDVSSLKQSAAQLELRERQSAVVANLGRAALAGEPIDALLSQAVTQIPETLGTELCKVLELTEDGKELRLVAGIGWDDNLVGHATVPTGIDSQAGYTLQTSGPVLVRNLAKDRRFTGPALLTDHGVVSGMSVAIGPMDNPWGVLGTHSTREKSFTIDDANFIQAAANVLWEAIQRWRAEARIVDRERRLTLVTDAMPVLIAYCDRDLVYRFCNRRYEDWFGLKQHEIEGKHLSEVLGEEAFRSVEPYAARALKGEHVSYEQRLPYRHGPERFVRVEYVPDQTDGVIAGYYAMIQDISEVVKGQQVQARLSAIVEHSNDAIIGKDSQGIVTSWNAGAERMYGYTAEEMIGQPLARITPEDRRNEVLEILERIEEGESIRHFETIRQCKDGSLLDVSLTVSPIYDHQGQLIGASSIARDITLRKQQEQRLKELNETLEQRVEERASLIKLLHDVTAACHDARTVEDAIAYVLREFSRYDGWCFGHAFRPFVENPDQLVPFMEYYEEVPGRFTSFRDATARLRLRRGQGLPGRVFASGKAELVVDQLGAFLPERRDEIVSSGIKTAGAFPILVGREVVAVLEFFSDETHELDERTVEAMESIGSQLGRVVERMRLQREIAELASQEQQRIGSELHDTVIQQLTGSEMMAESLRQKIAGGDSLDESDAAQLVDTLKNAQRQVRRLHLGLMPVEVDAAGLMSALENLADRTSSAHDLECVYECDEDVLIPDGTMATYLYRIAQEAVHNAVKHSNPGRITIALTNGSDVRLQVHDDGRGFDDDTLGLPGNGIRIMHYRAEVIGGKLTIQSDPNQGTTVTCSVHLAT